MKETDLVFGYTEILCITDSCVSRWWIPPSGIGLGHRIRDKDVSLVCEESCGGIKENLDWGRDCGEVRCLIGCLDRGGAGYSIG